MTVLLRAVMQNRFVRFIVAGSVQALAGYGLYLCLLLLLGYRAAFTVTFMFSILVSYLLNSQFVFRIQASAIGLAAFALYCIVYYVLSLVLLSVAVEVMHVDRRLAPLVVVGVMVCVNFVGMRAVLRRFAPSPEP